MYKNIATSMITGFVVAKMLRPKKEEQGSSSIKKMVYTTINCSEASSDLVDWSTGLLDIPTPSEEIEWSEFIDNVSIDWNPNDLGKYIPETSSNDLPKHPIDGSYKWERIKIQKKIDDPSREPENHEQFFVTVLPSGKEYYVWSFGGIEHWFSQDGNLNVESETEAIKTIVSNLEEIDESRWEKGIDEEILLTDTIIEMEKIQQNHSSKI